MPFLFELLALTLSSLIVCYAVGTGVLRLLRITPQEALFTGFIRLLMGLVVLTVGYAVFRTHGVTVLLPIPVLLFVGLYRLRSSATEYELSAIAVPPLKPWLVLAAALGMGVIAFAVQYLLVYEPGTPFLQTPFQDYVYYSRLTLPLNHLGIETNSLEMVFTQFQTEQPYHYLEIWCNAIMVQVTGLPSAWVYFISTTAVICGICGMGFAAIYTHCGVRTRWALLLGITTLSVTGTVWPFLLRFPIISNGSLLSHLPIYLCPKLTPIYLLMLLGVLLLLRQQFRRAGLVLATLPLVFVSAAPAVALGLGGLAIWLWLNRRVSFGYAITTVLPIMLVLGFTAAFYLFQPAPYHFPAATGTLPLASIVPSLHEFKLLLNIAIGVVFNYSIYFGGYALLVLLLLLWRKILFLKLLNSDFLLMLAPLLIWFTATLMGGILMRTLGHNYIDGFQFFSNPIIPLSAIMLAVFLGYALQGMPAMAPWLTLAVLLLLVGVDSVTDITQNTRFSAKFLQQVGLVLRTLPNRGGYLMGDADYENVYKTSADSYTAGTYVSDFKNDYTLLSLSALIPDSLQTDPRFARDSAQAELIKRRTTLYRYAKFRRLAGRPLPADSIQAALVNRANLTFLCASARAVLPPALRPLVRASYRDSYSGEVFYVLKPVSPTMINRP